MKIPKDRAKFAQNYENYIFLHFRKARTVDIMITSFRTLESNLDKSLSYIHSSFGVTGSKKYENTIRETKISTKS